MKKIIFFMLCSVILKGEIPLEVKKEISSNALRADDKIEFKRDQERAYLRIIALKNENKLTDEEFNRKIKFLKKRYGKNYNILYKYFARDLEESRITLAESQKIKNEKIIENKKAKKNYENKMAENILPIRVIEYINEKSEEKYKDDYVKRVEYQENLKEFYFFIKN